MVHSSLTYNQLGGVRTDKPLTDFEPHEAVLCTNARLNKFGQVATRLGPEKHNATQLAGTGNVLGIYDYKYGVSSQDILVCEDDKIYTDNGTVRTQIQSGQDTAAYYSFSSFDDFAWMVNGVDTGLKFDGTTVTNASIANPAVGAFAAAVGAAGALTGTYLYLVTFYVSATGQESQSFPLASAPSVAPVAQQVDLTNIPVSADSQVTARRIYRTSAGGSVLNAQLVTTIADNVTAIYTDNTTDANLGALVPLNHDPMPVLTKIAKHQNRAFGFINNSSRVYFSVLFNFWYWPQGLIDTSADADLFYFDVSPDDGDFVTNIVPYYDYLLIYKRNSIYILYGFDQSDFRLERLQTDENLGCISKRASVVAENWCYFLDRNGIYRTNAQVTDYVGQAFEAFFDPQADNTQYVGEKINTTNIDKAVMEVYRKKPSNLVITSVPVGSGNVNERHFLIDFKTNQAIVDDGYVAQSYGLVQIDNEDYLKRGDDNGWLWTEDSISGQGAVITSTATSATVNTITDTTLAMTVNINAGVVIRMLDGANIGETRTIVSNTATEFTVSPNWTVTPSAGDPYTVGPIHFQYQPAWNHYNAPTIDKRWRFFIPRLDTSGDYSSTLYYLFDFQVEKTSAVSSSMDLTASSLWDVALWDVGLWNDVDIAQIKLTVPGSHIHKWSTFLLEHYSAGQPIKINGYDKIYKLKTDAR